jgi:PPP family 3-phenylpropionic acid transporter
MGIATAIAGFLELPAMAFFPLILKRIRSAGTIMKLSGVFFIVKALITLLAPNVFWIYIAQCFQFFAYAMFIPSSVYYVNEVINEIDKIKGQTYMGMSLVISGMIGNSLGGLMLDTSGGVSFMLTVGIAVSIVGLIMLIFFDSFRTPREELVRAV